MNAYEEMRMDFPPERPLECSECKKPIKVCYTEVIGKMVYRTSMCADCPILRQKLHGVTPLETKEPGASAAGLCCGECGTTADEVRMGAPLGCGLCYEIFEGLILQELGLGQAAKKNSARGTGEALHRGRLPGQAAKVTPAGKLLALHQALHETLSREDYEQAAWLRDQIKELTQSNGAEEKGGTP